MSRKQQYMFAKSRKKVRINKLRMFIFILILVCIIVGAFTFISKIKDSDSKSSPVKASEDNPFTAEQLEQGNKIMIAARGYVYSGITYDPSYFGGYPPKDRGVCTDVVWEGFTGINVNLKNLVDSDIDKHFKAYRKVIDEADPGIDFRNVPVLEVFFERHAEKVTTNVRNILAWQPGDIVVFESSHIAMVSYLRNIYGEPYIIQHGKDPAADEDRINASDGMEISGHYRWKLTESFL